jgi:hypothetical protein
MLVGSCWLYRTQGVGWLQHRMQEVAGMPLLRPGSLAVRLLLCWSCCSHGWMLR